MLTASNVCFSYNPAREPLLDGIGLEVQRGETVAIVGPSGCGKSTLLHLLSGLLVPDAGEVRFDDQAISQESDRERSRIRLTRFGFVFQFGELIPELTVLENVGLPLMFAGESRAAAESAALARLNALGVSTLAERRTSEISGGESQRVAIARALAHNPSVLFADEPTGALDDANSRVVVEALIDRVVNRDAAVVVATHDASVANAMDRVLVLTGGVLKER